MITEDNAKLTRVKGFSYSGLLSDDEVEQFLSHALPKAHLVQISAIVYVDVYKPTLREHDAIELSLTKGLYVASSHSVDKGTGIERIEVYRQSPDGCYDPKFMKVCIAHEVGHSVYKNLPSELQASWRGISRATGGREATGPRSMANALEDFCEAYATYFLDRNKLRARSPTKLLFFETYLSR